MVVGAAGVVGFGVTIGPVLAPQVKTAGPGALYGWRLLSGLPVLP